MPRYFSGRNILVKTQVNPLIESENYSSYDPTVKEKYVTHNAVLLGKEGNKFIVEVKGSSEPIKVGVAETLELN